MLNRRTIFLFAAFAVLALPTLFLACESATDGVETEIFHPAEPNGNDLINDQNVFATPAGIDRAVDDGQGGYFVSGGGTIARLDASLNTDWTDATLLRVGELRRVASLGPWNNALIAVGSIDADSNGTVDAGGVAFFASDGAAIAVAEVFSDTLAVNLNGIVAVESGDPGVFAIVGQVAEGTPRPYAARIQVASVDSTISVLIDSTYTGMDGMNFGRVTAPPPTAASLYVLRNTGVTADIVELNAFDLSVGWETAVTVTDGSNYRLNAVEYSSGDIIAAGEVLVPVNDNSYTARAGLFASVTALGDSITFCAVKASQWQDRFDGLGIDGDIAYPIGRGYQVYMPDVGDNLGFGLIAKYDLAADSLLYVRTIGERDLWSGFSSMSASGMSATAFGFRQNPNTGTREGWQVDLDVP